MTGDEPPRDGRPTRRGVVRSATPRPATDGGSTEPRLFETFPDPLVAYETERDVAVVRTVNPAFEQTFGVEGATIAGERLVDHLLVETADGDTETRVSVDATERAPTGGTGDRDDEEVDEDAVLARLAEGEQVTVGFRDEPDDEPQYFRLDAVPPPNRSTGGYVVYTDVTELERQVRDLEARADRLERVVSVTAHDLRNPIDVAKIRLEAARDTGEDVHFEKIERALDRIQWIVQEVLAVGGGQVEPSDPVALDGVAEAAWSTVETADAALVLEDDLPTVEADADTLQQLFVNLFRNAVEHGGRSVTVTVGSLPGGFYVADDGSGIPSTERDRAFESGYSTKDDDAGLGLTIVEQVAEDHGWQVALVPGDGSGARFEFVGVEAEDGT